MRADYDLPRCLLYLVPDAIFSEEDNDYSRVVWRDARPMPTDAECAAAWPLVQEQDTTLASNESTLLQQAEQALGSNKAFLAITSPTNAQTLAQVKALTRQNNGLIRLLLRRLEAVD